jgi:photosystem II stability/assembly factor-like uncharacterized protein
MMFSIRLPRAAVFFSLVLMLAGCATTDRTAVTADTELQPGEGLVTLRLVDINGVAFGRFDVASEKTGEVFSLRPERFGQMNSMTFVGHLPAGRYRPATLASSILAEDGMFHSRTLPLQAVMGKFDVEARRVTDLGTAAFVEIDSKPDPSGKKDQRVFRFLMPLDPTPVPVDALLAARLPKLAGAGIGKSAQGWVPGTVPAQPAGLIDQARRRAIGVAHPAFVDDNTMLTGGPLGTVFKHSPGKPDQYCKVDSVHSVEAVLVLRNGDWLVGGEEGLLALSKNQCATWQRLPGLGGGELVIHLSQAEDGRLFMVTDRDREAVVYESAADPVEWKVVRRLPSARLFDADRYRGVLGTPPRYSLDWAAASRDRLVVHTWPDALHSLDLRTGQWETHETPRQFKSGIQATRDGYVVGMFDMAWIYGSEDYGKTWKRLSAWANMSKPVFTDRKHGIMMAANVLSVPNFKVRTTDDGGENWQEADGVGAGWWDRPLWTNPSGTLLYTGTPRHRIRYSRDQGRTWYQ